MPKKVEGRFWRLVDRSDPEECWVWLGTVLNNGYGRFNRGDRHVVAHRFAYEAAVGPIPEGLDLDHLCRNRRCVNPAHLEPVTRSENLRRGDLHHNNGNRAKTACRHGHPLEGANLYLTPNGRRQCRECGRRRAREHREAQVA